MAENIYNPTTGQGGYQIPGAALQPGWQWGAPGGTNLPTNPPAAPQPVQPVQGGSQNPPAGVFGNNPSPMAGTQFSTFLQNAVDRLNVNNDLMKQKNLLIKALYDSPLSPDELAQIPANIRGQLQGFNPQSPDPAMRSNLEMQLRLTNDSIAGRTSTLNQSIQFLSGEYDKSLTALETQKKDYQTVIQNGINQYGNAAFTRLTPDQRRTMERNAGLPDGFLDNLPSTISQNRYQAQYGFTPQTGVNGYDLTTYATDPNYSTAVSSIASNIGPVSGADSAQGYISSIMPNAPITGDMVISSASKYGVDPTVMMAQLQQESSFGTSSVATQNNNPAGISYTGSADQIAAGITRGTARPSAEGGNYARFPTLQSSLDYQAKWLSEHPAQVSDTVAISQAIENGSQPPDLTRLYGKSAAVRAELARNGFDLTAATLQWQAATKWVTALNSSQMARFKTLGVSVVNTIDEVTRLADALKLGGVPKMNLVAMTAWLETNNNSPHAQEVAQYLTAANTLKEEFANLAQGGYAPTEASWSLANKQINEYYGDQGLKASLSEVQRLINYRLNAPSQTSPTVPGGATNPYTASGDTGTGGDYAAYLKSIGQ